MSEGDLHSWKDIADYLGVSVRTAQKWEKKQQLPVRRLPGERGRVLALKSEIETWSQSLYKRISSTTEAKPSPVPAPPPARRRLWLVSLICVVLVLLLGVGYLLFSLPGQPANWRVDGDILTITDSRNREVWRWKNDWGSNRLLSAEANDSARFIWIGDLDGDGGNETLFSPRPFGERFYSRSAPLICFDRKGKERWRFIPGLGVSSGREQFPDLFHVINFLVAHLGRDRPNSIIVSAIHIPDYPCQISILDIRTGLPVRQYWHSGYIGHNVPMLAVADLDGNGISEIYLGGINQARYRPTMVVLDPDRFEGASSENDPNYQLLGFPPGREIRRVIFPNSCMNPGHSAGIVEGILIGPESLIFRIGESMSRSANLDYYFSRNGEFLKMSPGDGFRKEHETAESEGRIAHPFTLAEHRALERGVSVLPPSFESAEADFQNKKKSY